jgi:hypothetical protein
MSLDYSIASQNNNNTNKSSDKAVKPTKKKLKLSKKRLVLPNISSHNKILREIYDNKKLHGPIFLFTEAQRNMQKSKAKKNKKIKQSFQKMNEFEDSKDEDMYDFNVFYSQDEIIKNLMNQFYEKVNKKKEENKITRRRDALNKLYQITPECNYNMNEAKKFKSLDLEDYQKNILSSMPAKSMEQGGIMDLVQNLKHLKHECDSVKPLPPINIKIIEDHVYKKNNSKSVKKMKLKEFLEQSNEPKDEFEKEQRIIKNLRSFKVLPKFKRNKNYDFLPAYLRESLNKNLKFHL